ncbi:MAG: AbrB/MazE/SpoVT family DNA-binding domain-containing protein [Campylobacterales bacterium]|nr:AbrB/MazE/SpoVT family DNA-binding domain-containing protein [Campylobacterales bacterium]
MMATISKWGNSQGLRLPKDIISQLHLTVGDVVSLVVENGKVVIEPVKKEEYVYDINTLVSGIPKAHQASEEIASQAGKEAW